jgi:hypothetical protein
MIVGSTVERVGRVVFAELLEFPEAVGYLED